MRLNRTPYIIVLLFSLFGLRTAAQTEVSSLDNVMFMKLVNGMNGVQMPLSDAPNTEVTLYIRNGSVYDLDSLIGTGSVIQHIIAGKILHALQKGKYGITNSTVQFTSWVTAEQIVYKFACSDVNTEPCMRLLRDSVFFATFTQPEIDSAKETMLNEKAASVSNNKGIFDDNVLHAMYRRDYAHASIYGDTAKYQYINTITVRSEYYKYYTAGNAILTGTGKLYPTLFQNQFERVFNLLIRSEFNPETITKIIDFKPIAYNTQFVVNDDVQNPEFQICWQFPGAYSDQRASFCAYLLSALLNDPNNYLQILAAKMGCKKLKAQYEPNNFNGSFKIIVQPEKHLIDSTYQWLLKELGRMDQTLANESSVNIGKLLFKLEYNQLKKSRTYPDWIVKFWPYQDEGYFPYLGDSIMRVNAEEMKRFISEYIVQDSHVTGLAISEGDRNDLGVDSFFTDIDETVGDYIFKYRPNVMWMEGNDNLTKLRNLTQWLKTNRDIYLQVNGFSDEGEYNRAYDDSLIRFIDSVPTFAKTMPDIIRKGYMRPETMRAMKILKYLYDRGIEPGRLSGTSMMFHSSDKQQEADNMKCTITLTKLRKSISLYEYHYGKKKPE